MALVGRQQSFLAEHGDGLPVGADGDAVASGVFPFGGQPVAWLQAAFVDGRAQVGGDLLVGRPRVAGVWHCH